jgi:hypothetical protein
MRQDYRFPPRKPAPLPLPAGISCQDDQTPVFDGQGTFCGLITRKGRKFVDEYGRTSRYFSDAAKLLTDHPIALGGLEF